MFCLLVRLVESQDPLELLPSAPLDDLGKARALRTLGDERAVGQEKDSAVKPDVAVRLLVQRDALNEDAISCRVLASALALSAADIIEIAARIKS